MNLKLPDLITGKIVPPYIAFKEMEETKEKERLKKQYRHDLIMTLISATLGCIGGLISSIIFWLIST